MDFRTTKREAQPVLRDDADHAQSRAAERKGIAGAGGAEKSEERLTGAINGAAFGAGLGATLPYALQLVGKGAGSVRNMLGLADQERIAEQLVLRKLQQDKAQLGRDPSAPPPAPPNPPRLRTAEIRSR